jgi:hypothetical protein
MTQKQLIKYLKDNGCEFEVKGNKFIVKGSIYLSSPTSLPEGVTLSAGGDLYLSSLTSLPEGVTLSAGGYLDLSSLTSLPEGVTLSAGGYLYLSSLTSLPEGVTLSAGGDLDLSSLTSLPENFKGLICKYICLKNVTTRLQGTYLERFRIPITNGKVILYKRVSKDFLTQEGTDNETHWAIGSTLTHPDWRPESDECGAGKFHACAKPTWCNSFRSNKGDRYIAVEVAVEDLYEWTDNPSYPQKIGFRKGAVLYECDAMGGEIK